jgi:hypothetical protein
VILKSHNCVLLTVNRYLAGCVLHKACRTGNGLEVENANTWEFLTRRGDVTVSQQLKTSTYANDNNIGLGRIAQ